MLQGASLELLIRGYYTPSLGGRYPVGLTLLLSTLAPVMLQSGGSLFSLSAVNALLLGLLLGIWCLKRGNLWSACALRGAWLFASGWLFDFAPAGKHTGVRLLDVCFPAGAKSKKLPFAGAWLWRTSIRLQH